MLVYDVEWQSISDDLTERTKHTHARDFNMP